MRSLILLYLAAALTISSLSYAQQKIGLIDPIPAWWTVSGGLVWPLLGLGLVCLNLDICGTERETK